MAIFGKLAYDEGATVGTLLARALRRSPRRCSGRWSLATGGCAALRALAPPRRRRRRSRSARAATRCQAGCYFAALERIDASLLSLLLYTFPAIVAVAAIALGRERADSRRLGARSALALGGLVLVVAGAGAGALDPLGVALGLAAARASTARTSSSARAIAGADAAAAALGARLHRRGGRR